MTMTPVCEPTEQIEQVERLVADVSMALKARLSPIVRGMREVLLTEIPELSQSDQRLVNLLDLAIETNVDTILHICQYGIKSRDFELPSGATEHARRLAQHDVPIESLIRAYRLGQRYLLEQFFEEIHKNVHTTQLVYAAIRQLILVTFGYIDRASQEIVAVYDDEKTHWAATRSAIRTALTREVLSGGVTDITQAETTLGYVLNQYHLGAILWTDQPANETHDLLGEVEHAVFQLGREITVVDRPLLCACDERSLWAWFPLGRRGAEPNIESLRTALRHSPCTARMALGAPGHGIEGFRATHQQATRTQRLLLTATTSAPDLVSFAEPGVPTATLLAENTDHTRNLVRSVLGPLAQDDPATERLRETLLEYLLSGCSYTLAGARLSMHKNTVKYRVCRAEAERGKPLGEDRSDVEVALLACRWFGTTVLNPTPPTAHP